MYVLCVFIQFTVHFFFESLDIISVMSQRFVANLKSVLNVKVDETLRALAVTLLQQN